MCHPPDSVFAHTQVRDPHESTAACYTRAKGSPSPGHELVLVEIQFFRVERPAIPIFEHKRFAVTH